MFLQIENYWLNLVGDPHAGKTFKTGVPLHRRGEREAHQMEELEKQLSTGSGPDQQFVRATICMGDLFNEFNVSNEVLLQTFEILRRSALAYPKVPIYILMGNHDVSRNTELVSSFDLLSKMALPSNVHLVDTNTAIDVGGNWPLLLCPYNAFKTTEEVFQYLQPTSHRIAAVFGHWDTVTFGNDHNLLPYRQLAQITELAVTGHEHNPRTFVFDNKMKVIVTGSMLPYSFAEDEHEVMYVTTTVEEYLKDPAKYRDKCLRLKVKEGEEVPDEIDCLQLIVKKVKNEEQEIETNVTMENFSIKTLFTEVMNENNVSELKQDELWGKYENALQS